MSSAAPEATGGRGADALRVHRERLRAACAIAWLVMLGGGGASLAWLALAELGQGVIAQGTVVVAGRRQAVQHEEGGTVVALHVREGQRVARHAPLMELDATLIEANLERIKGRLLLARAAAARMRAEREGRNETPLRVQFDADAGDPRADSARLLQQGLLAARWQSFADDLAVLTAARDAQVARRHELERTLEARRQQHLLLRQTLARQESLAAQGFFAGNRLLDRQRELAALRGAIVTDEAAVSRLRAEEREIESRIAQRRSARREEIDASLVDVERELGELREQLSALEFSRDRVIVRAPAAGIVHGLGVHTVGGVVAPGQLLMEIVPDDAPLRIEARIPPGAVERLRPGLPVELRLSVLNRANTPLIAGVVTQVGADSTSDPVTREAFYRAEVRPSKDGRRMLKALAVQPGMPLEVFVRTGERSALSYLLKPLRDRFDDALTEG